MHAHHPAEQPEHQPEDRPQGRSQPSSEDPMNTPRNPHDNLGEQSPGAALEQRTDGAVFYLRPDTVNTATSAEEIPDQGRHELPSAPGGVVAPKVYDAEIVDDDPDDPDSDGADGPGKSAVPVDAPGAVIPKPTIRATAERHEVVPAWMRDRQEWRERIAYAARRAGHTSAYHAVRTPVYGLKVAAHAPRGAKRTVLATYRWIWDTEGKPLRERAVSSNDPAEYLKLAQMRDEHVRKRLTVAMLMLLAPAGGVAFVLLSGSFWLYVLAFALVTTVLGLIGRIPDKPVVGRAVVKSEATKLTSDAIVAALGGLGIAELNKALGKGGTGVSFPVPISREGPGWRADIDLPLGVTAGDVIERRRKLASGLRRQLGCVWPEPDPTVHEGRLVLWVGDHDLSKAKPKAWPLARGRQVDLFKPQPFGTDQRGRWVNVLFMYVSGIIGAIPRMGKTVTLRAILLIAALDPRAQLHPYDLKGTGDLSPFEPVAHRYGVGDDEDEIEQAVVAMREVREEMRRRTKVIRELPDEVCPDSRVEPHLASNTKLGLFPIVIGVDECQVWFEHDKHGKELEEICTDLVKRGPACGIMLHLATQRPDSKSIPTGISANASFRFCLKVMGQTENDMVLGTSSYKSGVRATTFAWGDKGIGFLRGDGEDARIVRGVYTDKPEAKRIIRFARALREQAGTITGHAAGQQVNTDAVRGVILGDVIAAFAGADKLWSEHVLERLAELRGDYAQWSPDALAAALKPYGVTPKQVAMRDVDGERRNRRGYRLTDVTTAAAKHGGGDAA